MATNGSRPPIDTTPSQAKPRDEALIRAAIRDLPSVLGNMDGAESVPGTNERIVPYHRLVKELVQKGHGSAASEWAIHALVLENRLLAWCGQSQAPSWQPRGGGPPQGGGMLSLGGLEHSEIESTPELWKFPGHSAEPDSAFPSGTLRVRPGSASAGARLPPDQMADAFLRAADHLRTLKPQFEQLGSFGWGCEASYFLSSVRPDGFNGWEPVLHDAPKNGLLRSSGLLVEPSPLAIAPGAKPPPWTFEARFEGDTDTFWMMEPAVYNFIIHSDRRESTPADCEACNRFSAIARYAGECLRSLDLRPLTFADIRTPIAQGQADAFWLLMVFDLAWQRRSGGLHAKRDRLWRAGNTTQALPYEFTREYLLSWSGRYPGTPPDRFYADLLNHYPDKLPEFFVSKLEGIAIASALAVDIWAADLRRLADLGTERSGVFGDRAVEAGAPPPAKGEQKDDNWLTVSQAAKLSGIDKGTISRLVDRGDVKSNGETGRKRRIDSADFSRYLLQRSESPERAESDEAVERKLRKAQQPPR
jgi:excisionase family DNA binding protein